MLHVAPDGPTLFGPQVPLATVSSNLGGVPRYLFRTFDRRSAGTNPWNNDMEREIASQACKTAQENTRTDILTLTQEEATEQVAYHCNRDCYGLVDATDNLVSWTSSLLYAVQYAIYRAHHGQGYNAKEVKICVVDTRKFPSGQFIQDTAERIGGRRTRCFFSQRLQTLELCNKEYLSQGAVNIANRCRITSLAELSSGSLFRLYPEFRDPAGHRSWTERVQTLREK